MDGITLSAKIVALDLDNSLAYLRLPSLEQ
jgi:hypothetical protein